MSDYDVIIIGTGAGGGTLARHLAPSGKRILLLDAATGCRASPRTGTPPRSSSTPLHLRRHLVRREGKPFQPQIHYFVGGATKLYGAALYRLRERDFDELATTTASPPRGRSATTIWSRTTPRPSSCTTSTAPRRGSRPSRPPAPRIHSPPFDTSRGSSSCPTIWPRPAITRSMRRAGSCLTSRTWRTAPVCVAATATGSRVSCTPNPTPRSSGSGPRSSTTTSSC